MEQSTEIEQQDQVPDLEGNLCQPCEKVYATQEEMDIAIQAEFDAELSKHYNPADDTDDEIGTLIKIKRLTETYITLFKKNVKMTPKALSIIGCCESFILKVKDRKRDVCPSRR